MMLIVFRDPFFHRTLYTLYYKSYGYIVVCGMICHTYLFILTFVSEVTLKEMRSDFRMTNI